MITIWLIKSSFSDEDSHQSWDKNPPRLHRRIHPRAQRPDHGWCESEWLIFSEYYRNDISFENYSFFRPGSRSERDFLANRWQMEIPSSTHFSRDFRISSFVHIFSRDFNQCVKEGKMVALPRTGLLRWERWKGFLKKGWKYLKRFNRGRITSEGCPAISIWTTKTHVGKRKPATIRILMWCLDSNINT